MWIKVAPTLYTNLLFTCLKKLFNKVRALAILFIVLLNHFKSHCTTWRLNFALLGEVKFWYFEWKSSLSSKFTLNISSIQKYSWGRKSGSQLWMASFVFIVGANPWFFGWSRKRRWMQHMGCWKQSESKWEALVKLLDKAVVQALSLLWAAGGNI